MMIKFNHVMLLLRLGYCDFYDEFSFEGASPTGESARLPPIACQVGVVNLDNMLGDLHGLHIEPKQ